MEYKTDGTRELTIEGTTLFERFFFLAENNCIREREVGYYSSQLCITPKYLSVVCKKVSDKNASEWIDTFTIQKICILLKNKNLTIKEISDKMNFSNPSFFGRNVHRLLRMSPSEYRTVCK